MELPSILREAFAWAIALKPVEPPPEHYCQTRDVLDTRMERLQRDVVRVGIAEPTSFLLHAVLSEIGGNAFDHNLGQWRDIPGCLLAAESLGNRMTIVIADRGQGIRATIRRVLPTIASDEEALRVAFTQHISGRAPERRGNGLKFVRETLLADGMRLLFRSGTAQYVIENGKENWSIVNDAVPGCLAVVSSTAS